MRMISQLPLGIAPVHLAAINNNTECIQVLVQNDVQRNIGVSVPLMCNLSMLSLQQNVFTGTTLFFLLLLLSAILFKGY